jgi:thioredoxin-like negative regulator of GroEL
MESLLAWVKVAQKRKLRVVEVDVDTDGDPVSALCVFEVPALVLVKDGHVLGRLVGRATGRQIESFIRRHVC